LEKEMNERPTPETDDVAQPSSLLQYETVNANFARKLERERDEAREKVKELIYIADRAIDLAEIDFENDKFGVVSELRGGLEKIKEETK
jgi:ABC-type nitrate/sulfonate/bicarbonate transport system ATPase subunit